MGSERPKAQRGRRKSSHLPENKLGVCAGEKEQAQSPERRSPGKGGGVFSATSEIFREKPLSAPQ
jgi:hypothetical protein